MQYEKEKFDFKPIGMAIKKARQRKRLTHEELAGLLDVSARHILAIENEGKKPSFGLLRDLVVLLDISLDPFFRKTNEAERSLNRVRLESLLNTFTDDQVLFLLKMADTILEIFPANKETD